MNVPYDHPHMTYIVLVGR